MTALEPAALDAFLPQLSTPRRRFHRLITWGLFGAIVLGGAYAITTHPMKYVSSATVVIVGSETVPQRAARLGEDVDPATQSVLARFGNLTVSADIFARIYESWLKQTQLARNGLNGMLDVTTKTSVVSDTPDHGPVLVFEVTSADPGSARRGVALAIADLKVEMTKWQAGADPDLSVSAVTITQPLAGLPAYGSRPRSAVGVIAFAALMAWLVGQADRSWLLYSSRRRQELS